MIDTAEDKKKLLSLRIRTAGLKGKRSGKIYYKSLSENIAHNTRREKMDKNYLLRPELSHKNMYHYPHSKEEMMDKWENVRSKYKNHYKRRMPSNSKPFIEGLLTFSATMQQDIAKYGRKEMINTVWRFLREEFSEDGVLGISLHMDETTPHIHFTVINWKESANKAYSSWMSNEIGKDKSNLLQDRMADWFKSHIDDWDYQRGEIHHIKEYHDKRKAQQDHLKRQEREIAQKDKLIRDMEDEIDKMNTELHNKRREVASLVSEISKMDSELSEQAEQIINDLTNLYEDTETNQGFLNKLNRYVRSENKQRLEKLIDKYQNALKNRYSDSQGNQGFNPGSRSR